MPISRVISSDKVLKGFIMGLYNLRRQFATKQTFKIGEKATISRVFDQNEVNLFAELTGDRNPLHTDSAFAKNTKFGRCVVHGALING